MIKNIIKMDLYCIFHVSYYKIALLVQLLACVVFAITSGSNHSGIDAVIAGFADSSIFIIFGGIIAGLSIGADFQNRVINIPVSTGNKRKSVIFGKTIVFAISMIPFIIQYPLVYGIIATIRNGWGSASIVSALGLIVVAIIACISIVSLFVSVSFMLRNVGGVIATCILFYLVFNLVNTLVFSKVEIIEKVFSLLPINLLSFFLQAPSLQNGLITLIFSFVFLALTIGLSYISFQKRDLK